MAIAITAVALVLLYNLVAVRMGWKHADPDAGGYTPRITDLAAYPKAYVHCVTALAVTLGLIALHVGPAWQVMLLVMVAAVLWEPTQGFINPVDILAGLAGAFLGTALHLIG